MLRVLLVEDHAAIREALAQLLARDPDIGEVVQAGRVAEALSVSGRIDIVVVDLRLPDGSGCEVIRALHSRDVRVSSVVLTGSGDEVELAEAVEAGADAVLHKSGSIEAVIDAIKRLGRGEPVMTPRQVMQKLGSLARARSEHARTAAAIERLTPREREVLQALAEGLSDKQIAQRLGVSPDTVRNHVAKVLGKLEVESRLQAVLFAIRHRAVIA